MKKTTKTVARSFAPEFSHFFDLALPLVLDTHKQKMSPARFQDAPSMHRGSPMVPLAERLAKGFAVVELWHQVPKRDVTTVPKALPQDSRIPFGRRVVPAIKDISLGYVEIPLVHLLQGYPGW